MNKSVYSYKVYHLMVKMNRTVIYALTQDKYHIILNEKHAGKK